MKKSIISLIITVSLLLSNFTQISAFKYNGTNLDSMSFEEIRTMHQNNLENIQDNNSKKTESIPEDYNQAIIDEINNNYNNIDISSGNEAMTDVEAQSEIMSLMPDNATTLASTSGTDLESFAIEPINEPFNEYQNENEAVSLATGALDFQKTLLSFPGRNNFDLDISIRYNSNDAVITKNEYENSEIITTTSFNQFAIGWSFNFTTISTSGRYGYTKDNFITFSDGSSYQFEIDSETTDGYYVMELKNYLLSDMVLKQNIATEEYVLTYLDGTKEYFDGKYGGITKREDRFGNCIIFEYEDIDYFRGSFIDYIFNPSSYKEKLHALSKITDSTGRDIDIDYTLIHTNSGKRVSKIEFKVGTTVYATLNLEDTKSYNGEIDVLSSIQDAEGLITSFKYEEKLSHIYYGTIDNFEYTVGGSNFLINEIVYPTQKVTNYEYSKNRRDYSIISRNWYEVYKVSYRKDSANDETFYYYDSGSDPHRTIVKKNGATTVHTFGYHNNKLGEDVYEDSASKNIFVPRSGTSTHNVVLNNEIYGVGIVHYPTTSKKNDSLYLYKQINDESEPYFLEPYDLDESIEISKVRTHGNNIYVFYRTGEGLTSNPYIFHAITYNTSTGHWSKAGNFSFTCQQNSSPGLYNMYYINGIFYSFYYTNYEGYMNIFIYNPTASTNSRWSHKKIGNFNYSNSDAEYVCSHDNKIYFKDRGSLYQYDLQTDTLKSKDFSFLKISDSVKGFVFNGETYVYCSDYLYKFDFDSGASEQYYYDESMLYLDTWVNLYKASDGNIYYITDQASNNRIYRFTPNGETSWELFAYRLLDEQRENVFMGHNAIYIQGESNALECVRLDSSPASDGRSRIVNTYNDKRQKISAEHILFKNGEKKVTGTESWTYVYGKDVLLSYTDILNNKTTYEYTNSTYYIPTNTVQYSGTSNQIITTNELSDNKTKILSATTIYDGKRLKTTYTYDSTHSGNVISETLSEIKNDVSKTLSTKEYIYDSKGVFVTTEKQKNVVTNGTNFTAGSAVDFTNTYTYNDMGLLASTTNAKGQITSYTYNKNGWPTRTVYPDNSFVEKSYEFNTDDGYTITTSHNDKYFTIEYYAPGYFYAKKEKGNNTPEIYIKSIYYDYGSKRSETSDANGNIMNYFYDVFGRPLSGWLDASNFSGSYSVESFEYDDFNMARTTTIGGKTKKTYYDVVGHVIKEEQETAAGLNTVSYVYDHMGNLVSTTDANNNSVVNAYNDMGQLISVTDQLGQATTYEYDSWGNVSKVTHGGSSYLSEYDSLGRLQKTTDAMGRSEYYAYDPIGNLLARKDRKSQTTNYTYDNMNRVLSEQTGTINIGYTYDDLGNILTMSDSTGTTSYEYQYNNLLTELTTPDSKTISYSYDNAGNVVNMTDYAGNEYSYTYDAYHRIESIEKDDTQIANYVYTDFKTLDKVIYPEGRTQYTYDNAGRIMTQVDKLSDNTILNIYSYTYDVLGNQIERNQRRNGANNITTYTYDAAKRLTSETMPGGTTVAYTFDARGNISKETYTHPSGYFYSYVNNGNASELSNLTSHTISHTYDANNRLTGTTETAVGGGTTVTKQTAYTYDNNGNMLTKTNSGQTASNVVEYEYDSRNRLTGYSNSSGTQANYVYNGLGQRISKQVNNGPVIKHYWDRGYICNEAENGIFTDSNYIGAQGVFGTETEDGTDYLFKNSLGDVTDYLSDTSDIVRMPGYDAYGKLQPTPVALPVRSIDNTATYTNTESVVPAVDILDTDRVSDSITPFTPIENEIISTAEPTPDIPDVIEIASPEPTPHTELEGELETEIIENTEPSELTDGETVISENELTDEPEQNTVNATETLATTIVSAVYSPLTCYVSDMGWLSETNGNGQVERNMSSGQQYARDGKTITVAGVQYEKGIGAHANSEIEIALNGEYILFESIIGLDDETGSYGEVVFSVYGDDELLYQSPVLNGSSAAVAVSEDVSGIQVLKLVVDTNGSASYDHADWADAKLTRASALSAPAGAVYLSDMEWLSSTNGWGPAERDMANGGKSSGDGKPLSINGLGFSKGIGAHAESSIEVELNGAYQTFSSYIGVDDAAPHHLSSVDFYVYGDDVLLYQSEQLTGADNALLINVDVSGVDILRLEIGFSNGDGTSDGADWALAHLIPAGVTAPVAEPTNPFGYRGEYTDFESGLIYLRNRYYDPSIGRFISEDPAKDGLNWYSYCANNPVMYVDPWGLEIETDADEFGANSVVYARLKELGDLYRSTNNKYLQEQYHKEAELIRELERARSKQGIQKYPLGYKYNTVTTVNKIKEYDEQITRTSIGVGVPKALISSILYREMMCFKIDDYLDPVKAGFLGDASLGLGQIHIEVAQEAEIHFYGKSQYTWENMGNRLMDENTNIYYVGLVLKHAAHLVNININGSYDYQNVNKVLARYNGTGEKAAIYGQQTSSYLSSFLKYYGN